MYRFVVLTCIIALAYGARVGPISSGQSRVNGGGLIQISLAPWHVAILEDVSEPPNAPIYDFICSGALIGDKHVLTSAFCLLSLWEPFVYIRLGSITYNSGGSIYGVSNLITHPDFNYPDNNIGLIVTINKIITGGFIVPAVLPAQDLDIPVNSVGNFTGWGAFENPGNMRSPYLRMAELLVIDNKICDTYQPTTERIFCVDGLNKGPCLGDEGGPFVIGGVVVGISGFGMACLGDSHPTFFAKVPTDWIKSEMDKTSIASTND